MHWLRALTTAFTLLVVFVSFLPYVLILTYLAGPVIALVITIFIVWSIVLLEIQELEQGGFARGVFANLAWGAFGIAIGALTGSIWIALIAWILGSIGNHYIFNGKLWKELVGKLPNRPEVASANSFILPSAIRYYLPAYMLTVACFWETKKSEVGVAAEVLISMLTNPRLKTLFDPLQAEEMRQSENYRAQVAAVRDLLAGNAEALGRFDSLHFPLHPPEHIIEQIQKKWDEFAIGLTDDQNYAIKSFLNFLITHYPEDFEDDVTCIVMGNSKF